jgi:hypothetical protein
MKKVLEETGNLKNCNFGPKDGGFNVLNTPDTYFDAANPDAFWDDFNKPFLDEAISRGDDIVLATNPTLNKLYKVNAKGEFIDNLGNAIDDISELSTKGVLTGFGKEMDYLKKLGYELSGNKMITP